jgi:hypothetical protein
LNLSVRKNPFLEVTPSLPDSMAFVFGHEGYHALDASTIASYQNFGTRETQPGTIASALKSAISAGDDVTSLLVTDAQVLMGDEANGNLAGWNAVLSTLVEANPNIFSKPISEAACAPFFSSINDGNFIINSGGNPTGLTLSDVNGANDIEWSMSIVVLPPALLWPIRPGQVLSASASS